MKITVITIFAVLLLFGCATQPIEPEVPIPPIQNTTIILEQDNYNESQFEVIPENINKETCPKLGGQWFYHFVAPDSPLADGVCNLPTTDAGKECQDSNECESYCQAAEGTESDSETTGTCYEFQRASCMQEVHNGVASGTWCE
jgi:hypothetical protein